MFYLHQHLVVGEGDEIQGQFTLGPNSKNPRDMDISIKYTHGAIEAEHSYRMC